MHLFGILSSLICIQLILIVSCEDTSDPSQNFPSNDLLQTPTILDNESDEEYNYDPRSTSFLRFGRAQSNFLRFGRNNLNGGTFLRFGRQSPPASNNFLRFGRQSPPASNNFLRFGRQSPPASNNFLRFGKKGEFLRFG